jgi:tRNA pseudouridine38-40 synthase
MTLFDEPLEEAPAPVRSRVRMTVAYDGTGYKGFAFQPGGVKTVAGSLANAIEKVLKHQVRFVVAGRTDAGVHAWGNVVHFDSPLEASELNLESLQRALNKMLRPSIVVRDAEVADPDFHARYSATARRYRYTVLNRPVPDPFLTTTTWHLEEPLDLRAMQASCDPLFGDHDFSSFCRKPPDATGSNVRRVREARWIALEDGRLRFDVEASSFCQQMVRSVVGTMVEVGLGKKRAGEMAGILRAKDRSQAGQVAPPQGLVLWEVLY